MSVKELLFIFLFLTVSIGLAQKKTYVLKGVVQDSVEVIRNVNIINLQTKDGASTNDFGGFEMKASLGDSILFSSVQHHPMYYVVSEDDIKKKLLTIHLSSYRYELEEIVLKKTNLTGSLELDMKHKKSSEPEINAMTLGLPYAGSKRLSQIDRRIYTASTSSSGVPLDLLFNTISGRLRKLNEQKRIIEENEDVEIIMIKMKHFLSANFNIKKEDHYRFLFYCRTDPMFNKAIMYDELALIEYLRVKSKEFHKISKEDAKDR